MNCLNINVRFYSKKVGNIMKYLNVAEKNDAAKTIAGHLSNGRAQLNQGLCRFNKIYKFQTHFRGNLCEMTMTSVSGHLLTYEFVGMYTKWHNCDPISLFHAPVEKMCKAVPETNQQIKKTLEREVKGCDGLIIWTDCDREGENIAFEIIDVCRGIKRNIPVYRAVFSEITAASVKRALANVIQPDEFQSKAVDIRSELDLRIGAAFTRYQTMRYQKVFPSQIPDKDLVSYGSCQMPTLGFVARRFNEVEQFIPQDFWKIKLSHTIDDLTVDFSWERNRLFDKNCVEALLMVCQVDPRATITNVVQKPKNKWRPQALDTVELEKLGSRKLKISSKETMTIAEKLYTQGLISYPRTETNMFSKDIDLRSLVEMQSPHPIWGNFANRVLEWSPNPRNGNKSDQAHPPIHPTKFTTSLSGREQQVYELVVRHFLACVSKDATGSETTVNAVISDEEFTATGLCIHERNYLDVYIYDKWNAKEIHRYQVGETFEPTVLEMVAGKTSAPSLLTEADLIALMDKHGIGTDATHAEHIETIKKRGYIGEYNGHLVPGVLGMGLVDGYDAAQLRLAYPELRAQLEIDLKRICKGERDPKEVLAEQVNKYEEVYRVITTKTTDMERALGIRLNETPQNPPDLPSGGANNFVETFQCPKCNQFKMSLRAKKNGEMYIGCVGFPNCKNAIWLPNIVKEIKVNSSVCPVCKNKKFSIKFKTQSGMAMLDSTKIINDEYISCLVCDSNLHSVLNIATDSVRKTTTNVQNRSNSSIGSTQTTIRNAFPTSSTNSFRSNSISNNTTIPSRAPLQTVDNRNTNTNSARQNIPSAGPNTSNWSSNSSSSRPNPNTSNSNGKCSICGAPSRTLITKKEGPNQGRAFNKCSTSNCNFFEWADAQPVQRVSTTWGTTAPSNSRSTNSSNQSSTRAARKCGICKQEGHTRQRCPRNT